MLVFIHKLSALSRHKFFYCLLCQLLSQSQLLARVHKVVWIDLFWPHLHQVKVVYSDPRLTIGSIYIQPRSYLIDPVACGYKVAPSTEIRRLSTRDHPKGLQRLL